MRAKVAAKRASARRNLRPAPAAQAAALRAGEPPEFPLVALEAQAPGLQEELRMIGTVQSPRRIVPERPGPAGFHTALALHLHCRSVRRADYPIERMLGFNCTCGGTEREWQVPLTDFRHYDRSVLDVMELLRHADEEDNWELRRSINVEDMARMGIDVADRIERWRDHVVADEAKRKRARRKAAILLHRHVDDRQWQEFRRKRFIHVTGSDGRLYRVENRVGSSVTLIVDGKDMARYCLVPKGHMWIPEADMMLAIKLMLETDALSFTQKANFFDLNRAPVRVEVDGRPAMVRINEEGVLVEVQGDPVDVVVEGPHGVVDERGEPVEVAFVPQPRRRAG